MKFKITNKSSATDIAAMYYVLKVVEQGRISESRNGPCYCFCTTFKNGAHVFAERTKNGTDTFVVSDGAS